MSGMMIRNDLYSVYSIYIYIYTCIYEYIYIEREIERERESCLCYWHKFFHHQSPSQSVELRKRCVAKRQWLPDAWLSWFYDSFTRDVFFQFHLTHYFHVGIPYQKQMSITNCRRGQKKWSICHILPLGRTIIQ